MLAQKSTETVTLTRSQLQTILELISQIGGINRSESWNESKVNYKNDNKITYNNISDGQTLSTYWEPEKEDMSASSEWFAHKNNESAISFSPLLMLNDSTNQISSPTPSDSLKTNDSRVNSAMTSNQSSCSESKYRRYVRSNDSEFDWNQLYHKKIKALEYSRALELQHQEKQRLKLEEQQRIKYEDQLLERKIEEQRNKMKREYDLEQRLLDEKKALAERKREAVIEAIERTPIIKKRNAFLIESDAQPSQPSSVTVAAIKPQSRTIETSAQTDTASVCESQLCDTGTQTDVQLLLYLLNEMKSMSIEKSKSMSKSAEALSSRMKTGVRSLSPKIIRKVKQNADNQGKGVYRRGVWAKNQNQIKSLIKTNDKILNEKFNVIEKKCKTIDSNALNEDNNQTIDVTKGNNELSMRRNSFANTSTFQRIFETNKSQRIMSSIEPKNRLTFLPQISGRPHSRRKWYSQEHIDPSLWTQT